MDQMTRLCGIVLPTQDSKIKQMRHFIKNNKLCVTTVGKNRNKIRILIDIKSELKKKIINFIPKDLLSHACSFLELTQRRELCFISKRFHQTVILTNKNDTQIKFTGHVVAGKYQTCVSF